MMCEEFIMTCSDIIACVARIYSIQHVNNTLYSEAEVAGQHGAGGTKWSATRSWLQNSGGNRYI